MSVKPSSTLVSAGAALTIRARIAMKMIGFMCVDGGIVTQRMQHRPHAFDGLRDSLPLICANGGWRFEPGAGMLKIESVLRPLPERTVLDFR
jgi:hypothetical protein